ncbi:MAG: hypothetical protein MSG64_18100 [Pyrinomonadaceae bacterium MAG19_C2-C3]|nr:hypothetical protein [Pyrinomonadaceae bacterium MAG19_C2-C3]
MLKQTVLLISIILTQQVSAQQVPKSKNNSSRKESIAKPEAKREMERQRRLAVLRVQDFAQHLAALRDVKVKAIALARFADLLWKDDEIYARALFTKALDACSVETDSSSTDSPEANNAAYRLRRVRRQVIAQIARRDAALAQRLLEAETTEDEIAFDQVSARAQRNVETALSLVKDNPDKATDFARQSLRSGVSPYMMSLLKELRLKDEAAANRLFIDTLARLAADPVADANNLLMLGTYIFTSPKVNPADHTAVAYVGIGNVMVCDITADRPNIPRELILAFLNVAVQVISRPTDDPKQQQLRYVVGYQLRPKAAMYAPHLVQPIVSAMHALMPVIPPPLAQEETYSTLKGIGIKNTEETLRDIEKLKNESARDERYLSLVFTLWMQDDFEQAREVYNKVGDTKLRGQLADIIAFGEGVKMLKSGQVSAAAEAADKLPPGVARATVWLGIARARAKGDNEQLITEAIDLALAAARNVNDGRRPLLTLAAAGELARLDAVRTRALLVDAVRQFNAQETESFANVKWEQSIEFGSVTRSFPLKVKGVEYGFNQVLATSASVDFEGTAAAIMELKSELPLAQALVSLAAAALK